MQTDSETLKIQERICISALQTVFFVIRLRGRSREIFVHNLYSNIAAKTEKKNMGIVSIWNRVNKVSTASLRSRRSNITFRRVMYLINPIFAGCDQKKMNLIGRLVFHPQVTLGSSYILIRGEKVEFQHLRGKNVLCTIIEHQLTKLCAY